jgi:hypothetical protein
LTPYSDGSTFIRPLGKKWIDPISFKTFLFRLQGYQIALLMIEGEVVKLRTSSVFKLIRKYK